MKRRRRWDQLYPRQTWLKLLLSDVGEEVSIGQARDWGWKSRQVCLSHICSVSQYLKISHCEKLLIVSRESEYQTYTVLIRIFRLPGPRGQASLISCCQLLASRLASATSGGSPTSVTRCEPYLYQCCPHWTCCYPVFNFFRTEAAPSSSRTSWCSPSSASPPSSSSSWLNTIQISKPTYHPPHPHC